METHIIFILYIIGWIISHYMIKYYTIYIEKEKWKLRDIGFSLIMNLFFWYLFIILTISFTISYYLKLPKSKLNNFFHNILPKYL